jgi:hypothetical protein
MVTCKKFDDLHPSWKEAATKIILERICGKSHIADITVEDSDIQSYEFKVTVCKYNTVKGWATIGYLRSAYMRNGSGWKLSFKPKLLKNEKITAGRTGAYS